MAAAEFIPFIPKCSNFKNIAGQRFGRLTVEGSPLRNAAKPNRGAYWRCRCDCGNVIVAVSDSLSTGNTQSCGCYQQHRASETSAGHRQCKTRGYFAWSHMRQRCDNPKTKHYAYYGWRGITYDPRWTNFETFLADMGECPPRMEIDRIDTNGNYCKDNCRWATRKQNQNNKRSNVFVEYLGERMTLTALAEKTGIPYACLFDRIRARGWSVEHAVTKPRFASRFKHASP